MGVKLWESRLTNSLGAKSINRDREAVEGPYAPPPLIFGISVGAMKDTVAKPMAKVLIAKLLLTSPILGAGDPRLPINPIQKTTRGICFGVNAVSIGGRNVARRASRCRPGMDNPHTARLPRVLGGRNGVFTHPTWVAR